MRTRGSVRFETYYKLQRWEARVMAWIDLQKAFPSLELAEAARARKPGEWRVMEVSEAGRRPLS